MSSIEQLLDALDNSRERLLMAMESLPDEALLEKQVIGDWSICDVLNNITAWEAEMVTGMMRLQQNKQPVRLLEALKNPDSYDSQCYAENQDRDLDQVFIDLQQVRVQLEDWISEFTERELDNPKRYSWFNGKSLKEVIAATSYEREKRFIPYIQLFAQQWSLLEWEEEDSSIPLTMVNLTLQEDEHEDTD